MPTVQKEEGLRTTIRVLKETAERFRELDSEADLLMMRRDVAGSRQKMRERAQLLVTLPNRLGNVPEGISRETKKRLLFDLANFAAESEERLEKNSEFSIAVLLTHMGSKETDKNDLEELIDWLESRAARGS